MERSPTGEGQPPSASKASLTALHWRRTVCAVSALIALALNGCALDANSTPTPTATTTVAHQPHLYVTTSKRATPPSDGLPVRSVVSVAPGDGSVQWQVTDGALYPFHQASSKATGDALYLITDTSPTQPTDANEPSGFLSALRSSDGSTLWKAQLGAFISQPVVAHDTLYASAIQYTGQGATISQSKWLYALHTTDGTQRWRTQIPGDFGPNDDITLVNGVLYVTSNEVCFDSCNGAYLFAVRASDGKLLWKNTISGNLNISAPTVDHGVVLLTFPSFDNVAYGAQPELAAYDAASGASLWSRILYTPLYRPSDALFIADGGIVYAGVATPLASDPTRPDHWAYTLAALDGHTGALTWQVPTSLYPTIVAHDAQTLYVQTQTATASGSVASQTLASYQRADGKELWHAGVPVDSQVLGVQGGVLLSVVSDFASKAPVRLLATSASDGGQRWQTTLGPGAASPPVPGVGAFYAITSDTLYIVINGTALYAVAPSDGHIRWRQTFDASVMDIQAVG